MHIYRYVRFGYFVDAVDLFDAAAFRLAASEAAAMDPQTRICLEQTQAGPSPQIMPSRQITPLASAELYTGIEPPLSMCMLDYFLDPRKDSDIGALTALICLGRRLYMVPARDRRAAMLQQAFTWVSCTLNTLMQCSPLRCALVVFLMSSDDWQYDIVALPRQNAYAFSQ